MATPPRQPSSPSRDAAGGRALRERSLADEVQYVKGVGPALAASLAKLDIRTAGDLLYHLPRRYEDRTRFAQIADLRPGETATVLGRVISAENSETRRRNLTVTKVLINDGTGIAQITFWQQPYLLKAFRAIAAAGGSIIVYGLAKSVGFGAVELDRVEWEEVSEDADSLSLNRIVPIYPSTAGVSQKRLRRAVDGVLRSHLELVVDPLPPSLTAQHQLANLHASLRNVHFPESFEALEAARRRLIFQEFFLVQVGLARRRALHSRNAHGIRMHMDADELHRELRAILPFELTAAQERAIQDILKDMGSGYAMNRLIQGDVGSGKTVVALAAMLIAARNGFQSALMAPTEILAQQHALVLRRMLEPLNLPVELATGSLTDRERDLTRARLASGDAPIVVGTHALIEKDVQFERLGLAIVDEQHRFGVMQRAALYRKAERPHLLIMTATPIPRTLTLTLYGDLDTSLINELPPGRKPIKTHWKPRSEATTVYERMRVLLDQGRQAYIVCPLIEESEKVDVRAATKLARHIQRDLLPGYRVGLLHGQMRADEKDEVMRQFKAHELDVLVSTTVIEVGIDVPNATVMVIEDADRFGLAQLHQLRGRVGRGEHASFCILLADPKTEDAEARLRVMVETQDGFRIAEEDLRIRGPGEFFGTKQSGLPEFIFGDVVRDAQLLDEARRAAFDLVEKDPNLTKPENAGLRRSLEQSRFGFELIHVS